MDKWFGFKEGTKFQGLLGERFLSYKDGGWHLVDSSGQVRNPLNNSPVFIDNTFTTGMAIYDFNPEDRMKENTVQKYYIVISSLGYKGTTIKDNSVKYELDKFVYPDVPGDYSIVYDNLELAQNKRQHKLPLTGVIYECEVEGIKECEGKVLAYGVKLIKIVEDPKDDKISYGDILEGDKMLFLVTCKGLINITMKYKGCIDCRPEDGLKKLNEKCMELSLGYSLVKSKANLVLIEAK